MSASKANQAMFESEILQQIIDTEPVDCGKDDQFEVHMLVCARDFHFALWCLKSFWHFSGRRPGLVVHDDGTLSGAQRATFREQFRKSRVIDRKESDAVVDQRLASHPCLHRYRFEEFHPLSIKLLDAHLLAAQDRILVLDADILFFAPPDEILTRIECDRGCFMNDLMTAYALGPRTVEKLAGLPLCDRVNSGIVATWKSRLDLELLEDFAQHSWEYSTLYVPWIEQTGYALMVSRTPDRYDRLSGDYHMPFGPFLESTVACHYLGRTGRILFVADGIPRLLDRFAFVSPKTRAGCAD